MHTRNRIRRSIALVLCTALMTVSLAACGKQLVVKPETSDEPLATTPVETPKSTSEIFAENAKQALMEAVKKSDKICSMQLNFLLDPAAQLDESEANYTKSAITLTDTSGQGANFTISLESALDPASGDAFAIANMQSGSEVASSGGIYFTGNNMLIKKADVEKPMIQHTFDPAVAESYKSATAIERFTRALSNPEESKMSDEQWATEIDTYLKNVLSFAQEADFLAEEQSVSVAGTTQMCNATTLSLTGESAVSAIRGIYALIALDNSFKSLFVSQYMLDEETYGVTGIDGVLRDIDALTSEERNAMTLTLKTLQGENTTAIYAGAATGAKATSLLFKFFQDGYQRQNDITFAGIDGSTVKFSEQNVSSGGDSYNGQMLFESAAPGGILQEHSEITTQSTISQGSYSTHAQFSYARAAAGENSAADLSGSIDYAQQDTAQGVSGTSTGTITSVQDGETSVSSLTMTLEQSDAVPAITAPDFIPEAGRSSSDQAGLYTALDLDESFDNFNRAPASIRIFTTFLLMYV